MGLFEWFNFGRSRTAIPRYEDLTKKSEVNEEVSKTINQTENELKDEIPREIFIEESDPAEDNAPNITYMNSNGESKGIESVYAFLQADYETRGYNDALANPDDNYKNESVKLLRMDLDILLQRANLHYEDLSKEAEVHIITRSNAGLVDLVQELKARKSVIDEHKRILAEIKADIEQDDGKFMRVRLSYQRGFLKGLTHLTNTNILNKKISS
jgi:hypothetical protein